MVDDEGEEEEQIEEEGRPSGHGTVDREQVIAWIHRTDDGTA